MDRMSLDAIDADGTHPPTAREQQRASHGPHGPIQVTYGDPVDAIAAAGTEAQCASHDLAGFSRRSRTLGYRFVARCRKCGTEIVVHRVSEGWGYPPILDCVTT